MILKTLNRTEKENFCSKMHLSTGRSMDLTMTPSKAPPQVPSTGALQAFDDENGSAIAEFVMIATPLFIPAILFFNALHGVATDEINVSYLARQAIRAFATAPDLETGHRRVKFVLDKYSEIEAAGKSEGGKRYGFTYNISCGSEKCLTPGSLVEIQLFRQIRSSDNPNFDYTQPLDSVTQNLSEDRKAVAVARSYVDKWRATES